MANFGLQHIFVKKTSKKIFTHTKQRCRQKINHSFEHFELVFSLCSHEFGLTVIMTSNLRKGKGAIPNFATEKEQKRIFLYFTDVTLVVVDIKSERFIKRPTSYPIYPTRHLLRFEAIPNLATEKEKKRNFLYFTDVTLVVVDIKSERSL